jgi:hypothetical protein
VRQVLRRHGPALRPGRPGPPSARERELIARATWLAIDPALTAARLGRSVPSVRRAADDERAARLRVLPGVLPAGTDATASWRGEPVSSGLGAPGETDLLRFIRAARSGGVVLGAVERPRTLAYRALLSRAASGIAALPPHGAGANDLDRIETDLRWAVRLKAELVRSQLPLLVRTIESVLARPMEEIRAGLLVGLVAQALGALSEAVDAFEPGKGGRLAGPAGLALTRIATRFVRDQPREGGRARATALLAEGVTIPDWARRLCPWQAFQGRRWLEPDARVRLVMPTDLERRLLDRRYGWGPAPATLREAALELGMTPMRAAAMEREAVHRALTSR